MNRSTVDKIISTTGVVVAILLLAASAGLFYAHDFIHTQVRSQLAEQNINFPTASSPALTALPAADQAAMSRYAGQQLLTGAQAETFADHFIRVHLTKIGGGKTYAQLSAMSMANPSDAQLAGQVNTVFRGETLRGLLLNAYAFDTMGMIAYYAAWGALAGAVVLLLLALLGFSHADKAARPVKKRR